MSKFTATRRLIPLIGALLLAAGVAMATQNWVPAVAVVPLVGVLLWAFGEALLPLPRAAARRVPGGLLVGDEFRVHVDVERRALPFNMVLVDGAPDALAPTPAGRQAFRRNGRHLTASYEVKAVRRGEHRFSDARVGRVSVLGLFQRWCRLPAHTVVTVWPPTARQQRVRVRARPRGHAGLALHLTRSGTGDEFYALREYLPGDPLSDVNWKATARMGRVITNEFLPEEPPRYLLYLDTRGFGREAAGQADVFERTLEAGAVLADALLEQRAHVGIVMLSYWSSFVVPARGGRQGQRMRQLILDCQPGDNAPIEALVKAGAPHLPSKADAILVSSDAYDATMPAAVSFLRRRHGRVSVLSAAFPEPPGEEETSVRAAGALLNAELATALERLRGLAERTVIWREEEPLNVVLARLGMAGRTR